MWIAQPLCAPGSPLPAIVTSPCTKSVACGGNGVLFVGKSWDTVYRQCLKRGLKPDEFVVDYIEPGALHDLDMEWLNKPL